MRQDYHEQEPLTFDALSLGLARPQTLLGAPYAYTVGVLMFSAVTFLIVKNPFVLIIGAPLMLLGRLLIRFDPYQMQVLAQYFLLRAPLRRSSIPWSLSGRRVISVSPWSSYSKRKK